MQISLVCYHNHISSFIYAVSTKWYLRWMHQYYTNTSGKWPIQGVIVLCFHHMRQNGKIRGVLGRQIKPQTKPATHIFLLLLK